MSPAAASADGPGLAVPAVAHRDALNLLQAGDTDPLGGLSAEAERLLIGVSVYREPVDHRALPFCLGASGVAAGAADLTALPAVRPGDPAGRDREGPLGDQPLSAPVQVQPFEAAALQVQPVPAGPLQGGLPQPGPLQAGPPRTGPEPGAEVPGWRSVAAGHPAQALDRLLEECSASKLLAVRPAAGAGQPEPRGPEGTVLVSRPAAIELHRRLAADRRAGELSAAHRRAAEYWLWRVTALPQDRQADIHDLLEARHHLVAAGDPRQAEAITEGICAQLRAAGSLEQEASLIRETLLWLPQHSPRRAGWIHQLGNIAQLQGDVASAARRYHQALTLFGKLADSVGLASVRYDLAVLGQAGGDAAAAGPHAGQPAPPPAGLAAAGPAAARGPGAATGPAALRPGRRVRRMLRAPRATGTTGVLRWAAMAAGVLAMTAGLLTLVVNPNITARPTAGSRRSDGGRAPFVDAANLRLRAAGWVARKVSRDAIVACDPVMCGALRARGIPAASMLLLGPGAPDPLGSDVVVATPAVRNEFGGRLAGVYAPAVIASLGSGTERIDIRAVAPDGAAAYWSALSADLTERRQAGAQLLRNPRITVSLTVRSQLASGLADARLLITLAALAAQRPVYVAALGGSGPGATAGLPLTWAQIAPGQPAAGQLGSAGSPRPGTLPSRAIANAAFKRSVLAFLQAQRPPYLVTSAAPARLADGQPGVFMAFSAPSPLGLLSPPGAVRQDNRKTTVRSR